MSLNGSTKSPCLNLNIFGDKENTSELWHLEIRKEETGETVKMAGCVQVFRLKCVITANYRECLYKVLYKAFEDVCE